MINRVSLLAAVSVTALMAAATQVHSAMWSTSDNGAASPGGQPPVGPGQGESALPSAFDTFEAEDAKDGKDPLTGLALPKIDTAGDDGRNPAGVGFRKGLADRRLFPTQKYELKKVESVKTEIELKVIPHTGPGEWFIPRPTERRGIYDTERDLIADAAREEAERTARMRKSAKSWALTDGDMVNIYPASGLAVDGPRDPMVSQGLAAINFVVNGVMRVFHSISIFFKSLFAA